jgi:hypothetical protein
MALRSIGVSGIGEYDGSNGSVLAGAVQRRVDFLLERIGELPREIEEKKQQLSNHRDEIERLRHAFPSLLFDRCLEAP